MEINEISDGLEILPGRIYLSPPGKDIRIQKGNFHVTARRGAHLCLPVDDFFESLAEEAGERAVAVIFSGAGTDGARGIQSIRMTGGTVFVQNPGTAEFTGMPLAAINTGQVDGVFPPENIAREILRMQEAGELSVSAGNLISASDFQTFYRLIREKTGYNFDHYKKTVVARRLRRRMYLHGVSSVRDYFQIIKEKDSEASMLASDLMIGVTSFFRDRQSLSQFIQDALLEEYAPAALAINQNYDIVYHNGPTNRYLRQPRGAPTQNLLELLPESLLSRIRAGIYRTNHEARPVSVRMSIQVDDGKKRQVTLRISKLKENLYLMVFREKSVASEQARAAPLEPAEIEETAVRQLETELSATQEALQSNIEQLKSMNEELITVNSQLQGKIEEQEEINETLERRIAERTAEQSASEEKFRATYEQAAVGIELVDLEGRFIKGNGKLSDILGYNEEQLCKLTFTQITHPDDLRAEMRLLEQLIAGQIPSYSIEKRYIHKDGHIVWVRVTSSIARTTKPYRIAIIEDITERKRVEQALLENEQRLARSQEIAHLGSWELDLVANRLTWSDEVYRIFGLQPQEFRATYEAFLERVHSEDRATVDAAYARSVQKGKNFYEIEHRIVRKGTGEVRWVHERCQHFRDASGRIIRSVGMIHDISKRKKAEEELHKLTEDLKRSNSDLQQFAYIASHDLQSPLRNIEGFVKMLARRYKGQLDEKADEFIHYIFTGVKDMQMLILDILEYSKVGSDGKTFKTVDSSLCVAKAISNLNDAIAEKNADIIVDKSFPTVFGDSIQLTSLFQNLIGNAIKFCKDTPRIHLSAQKEDQEYIFSIRDNGIGIDPKDSDKIFSVFHRLHSKSEYPGTGIGLALCKKIVERHGGRIWAESEPGKGSTFYFALPIME